MGYRSASPSASMDLRLVTTDGSDGGSGENEDDELRELISKRGDGSPGRKKERITRSKVGSVDNLAAYVSRDRTSNLSERHVKYQTRAKMKAPKTNWVSIDGRGVVCKVAADKRAITKAKELGVSTRELRMFDQIYGHFHNNTTRILVRENALLFVMEGYRLIITKDEVFMPLFGLPPDTLSDLIKELEYVLKRRHRIIQEMRPSADLTTATCCHDAEPNGTPGNDGEAMRLGSLSATSENEEEEEEILPFELRVFEVALGRVVANFKDQIVELDEVCHPALEALTRSVDKVTLDHVRMLKNKHSKMTKKVEAVVEELERIMDDDDDMRRMILSEEFFEEPFAVEEGEVISLHQSLTPSNRRSFFQRANSSGPKKSPKTSPSLDSLDKAASGGSNSSTDLKCLQRMNRSGSFAASLDGDQENDPHDPELDMVENLLEFYFSILDHAFDCLKTLEEIIDNTEEMINIELDTARNRLIKLEILLTGSTFTFTIYAVVAGVLGENLDLPQWMIAKFWIVNLMTVLFCSVLMCGLYTWCRYENLL